ncbi:hypothetical protein ACE4RU_08210 [Actinobacillus seminis]|uniref:hypothetical protein n=1 Tax=Actinobacillus seminis TaxID=722 RepID=UPI003B935903
MHKNVQFTGIKGIENRGKIENRSGDIQFSTKADIQQNSSIVARSGNIQKQANKQIS